MKKNYDFSAANRGPVVKPKAGKTRITIRIDEDILDWFRDHVERAGGGNYQTLINDALRKYIELETESLEDIVRRVVRQELRTKRRKTA